MVTSVFIVSTGARTPLGLNSAASAAAYRAGLNAMGDHPFMIDQSGDPMPGALDVQLDPGVMGPQRLLALAESAVREACVPLTTSSRASHLRLPLYLGLPELRPGFTEQDSQVVRAGLMELKGLPISLSEVHVFPQGHASGLTALAGAVEKIQQGTLEACLVGGVESYFHPDTMEWLDENRQLAGAVSRSGFVPGEGAGCCLLMTASVCTRLNLGACARVLTVASDIETKLIKTSNICLGEGLTSVVRRVVSSRSSGFGPINMVICDINGERYRGEEWGFVCLRLSQYFDDPAAYWSPADSWGDMGAASAPLFAMLACQAAARGYAKGPRTLLWASSEKGLRGAAVLEAVGNIE
jgi:3-oxoacyl-[acyl-carrier-protein] synthase-1